MLRNAIPYLTVLPATAYSLITLWCGWSFFKGQAAGGHGKEPEKGVQGITILKPVKGMDEGSYENFASFCCQHYRGDIQLLFAVASSDDPAIEVITRLESDFPEMDIGLNIDSTVHGPNLKVSNLINAFPKTKHDIIIICDSDIRVKPDFLSSVSRHFTAPDVGLVTSPYCSRKVHGPVTALEALAFTSEMTPNVLTALKLEGLSFALGASMAVRRKALDDIGGLAALVDYLADDYQLGNKVHRAGWRLVLDSQFVESMMRPESFRNLLSRQLRWSRTMRVSRPGGYLASGLTLPGLAVIAAVISGPNIHSLLALIILYSVKLPISTIYSRIWAKDGMLPAWWWLLPVRDVLASATWVLSFLGNRVVWRGERFEVMKDGRMMKVL